MLIAFFANFENKTLFDPFHKKSEEVIVEIIKGDIEEQRHHDLTADKVEEIKKLCHEMYQLPNVIYTTSLTMPEPFFTDPIVYITEFYIERLKAIITVAKERPKDFIITTHLGLYHFGIYRLDPVQLEPFDSIFRQHMINQIIVDLEEE